MNEQKLSLRLERVASFVPENAVVADIGSDHAYLPAWLCLSNKITKAIAGEVVKGPYESAVALVNARGLQDKISVRMADGLEVIKKEDQVTAITICGMGGSLIRDILDRGKNKGHLFGEERLILQPNIGEYSLRKWLQKESYHIEAEEILEEDGKIYEIIVAEKKESPTEYSEKELYMGPLLSQQVNPIYRKKWAFQLEKKETILTSLKKAKQPNLDKVREIQEKILWMKEVLG